MFHPLMSLFGLYILNPRARIYTLKAVRELASYRKLNEIVATIDVAIAHDEQALELDAGRRAGPSPDLPSIRKKDGVVDRRLASIERTLRELAVDEDEPSSAAIILARTFPLGLGHHTRLPAVEQSAANKRVLDVLRGEDYQEWLTQHGVMPWVDKLAKAQDEFIEALQARANEQVPSFEEVRAARARGQELYLLVVAKIVAHFGEDVEGREQVLAPIWTRDEAVQSSRRRRSAPAFEEGGEDEGEDDGMDEEGAQDAGMAEEGVQEGQEAFSGS